MKRKDNVIAFAAPRVSAPPSAPAGTSQLLNRAGWPRLISTSPGGRLHPSSRNFPALGAVPGIIVVLASFTSSTPKGLLRSSALHAETR